MPVDDEIMQLWAALSADRQRKGRPLAQFDGLIAATALKHGFTLATRDVNDFLNLGVALFNPWEERSPEANRPQARESVEAEKEQKQDLDP